MKDILNKAIQVACIAHHGQFDKGGKSYILHCLEVMTLLKSDCIYLQSIAILHDSLEDSDLTVSDLYDYDFPTRVVEAVDILSKFKGQSNSEYLDRICSNRDSMLVKLADLEHNSQISRQPNLRRKDLDRLEKYFNMYKIIKASSQDFKRVDIN